MNIKEPNLSAFDVEITETYIDEDGKTKERKRKVSLPNSKGHDADTSRAETTDSNDQGRS